MGMLFSIASTALSFASSAASTAQSNAAQKSQLEYQAAIAKRNADMAKAEGEIEQSNLQREKDVIRDAFEFEQGQNINQLGARNMDITSGSAAAALEGNINRFADDIAWNGYQKELSKWSTGEKMKGYEAQRDYLQKTADALNTDSILSPGGLLLPGLSMFKSGAKGKDFATSLLQIDGITNTYGY